MSYFPHFKYLYLVFKHAVFKSVPLTIKMVQVSSHIHGLVHLIIDLLGNYTSHWKLALYIKWITWGIMYYTQILNT